MVGGVFSDIFHAEDRNTSMALFSGGTFFGTGLGPLVSGFIAQHISWRWIYYLQAIMAAVVLTTIVFFFKESRGSVLLSRKAHALNRYYASLEAAGYGVGFHVEGEKMKAKRIRWKVKSDEERESLAKMISISLYRPFRVFFAFPHPRTEVDYGRSACY